MYLLSYVHVCVTRTGWKTRPRPKTVILPIKKSNQIKSLSLSLSEIAAVDQKRRLPLISTVFTGPVPSKLKEEVREK